MSYFNYKGYKLVGSAVVGSVDEEQLRLLMAC